MPSAYPREFRECVLLLVDSGEVSIRQLARALPVSETTLRRWVAATPPLGHGRLRAGLSGVDTCAAVRHRDEVPAHRKGRRCGACCNGFPWLINSSAIEYEPNCWPSGGGAAPGPT
ncbi:helix-turn-helix domain-containing protein [Nocardia sp. NPDC050793]|uniref:helix-turn-helix domain-containing protein n=1 Tax=Nocardia sp. NPDC050793 TaxID=3155159 RepID=UPI0033E0655D